MTSNNLPLNFFVNLDLFVSRIAIANQISQQFALYKLLLLLVLADRDNDAVTIGRLLVVSIPRLSAPSCRLLGKINAV